MTKPMRALSSLIFACSILLSGVQASGQGTLEEIRVLSSALEGNLEGNDPERVVFVYLPPGYATSDKRYPVVYFLHGYAVSARVYVDSVLRLPGTVDEAMASGADEVIIVMPDAFTRFGGSFYSNSPTIGDWESFIARDLVSYIDTHYRTIVRRDGRGLSGHSMGGYGTLRIGMAYPEVFGALYAMSSGAVINTAPAADAVKEQLVRMAEGIRNEERNSANGVQAQAAAWAPNPQNPPYYFDLPYNEKGEAQPFIAEKWAANSILLSVDQHVPALRSFSGILLDVGNEDGLEASNTHLDAALTRLDVPHEYEIYEGTHGNKVGQRFIEKVLPFFAENLRSE